MAKTKTRTTRRAPQARRPDPRHAGTALAASPAAFAEQSCIDRRLERLDLCTGDLLSTTKELEERLQRVMLAPTPPDTSGDAPAPVMTALSSAIDRQADRVLEATRQLQGILRRLGL